MKRCTVCNKEYPATTEYFPSSSAIKSGLRSACKVCTKEKAKVQSSDYYKRNKEKVNKKNMENYYKKNPKEVLPKDHKRCSVCKEVKHFDLFGVINKNKDGKRHECSDCRKEQYNQNATEIKGKRKKYYIENKSEVSLSVKRYREKNIEWYQEYNKKYYQDNKERMIKASKDSLYRRIETDYGFKILQRLRKRMWDAMSGKVKSARTAELIGCSVDDLRAHIEKQFTNGMSWDNYGKWHLDHIIPCASFDLSKPENQRKCFHYTNLQPLWAVDNIRKSNKIEY